MERAIIIISFLIAAAYGRAVPLQTPKQICKSNAINYFMIDVVHATSQIVANMPTEDCKAYVEDKQMNEAYCSTDAYSGIEGELEGAEIDESGSGHNEEMTKGCLLSFKFKMFDGITVKGADIALYKLPSAKNTITFNISRVHSNDKSIEFVKQEILNLDEMAVGWKIFHINEFAAENIKEGENDITFKITAADGKETLSCDEIQDIFVLSCSRAAPPSMEPHTSSSIGPLMVTYQNQQTSSIFLLHELFRGRRGTASDPMRISDIISLDQDEILIPHNDEDSIVNVNCRNQLDMKYQTYITRNEKQHIYNVKTLPIAVC
jgi:hypothetical protein